MDIVNVMNKVLQKDRENTGSKCKSFFVEHKTITPHPTFKTIKVYTITVYIVKQDKDPVELFRNTITFNSSQKTPEEVYKEIEENIAIQFFTLVRDFEWSKIVNGHFESKINGTLN